MQADHQPAPNGGFVRASTMDSSHMK
jgi:hypothetical protein